MKIETVREPDRLVNYWMKEKGVSLAILCFGLAFNVSAALAPVWQGKLIDAIASSAPFPALLSTAVAFVVIVSLIQVARYFKRYYIRRFANGTIASMRLAIYRNILARGAGELEAESTGNLMTRALSDVALCVEGMRKFTTELFDTGVILASYIATLFIYDARITLLSVASVPVAMLLAEKLKGIIYRYTVDWRKKNAEMAETTWNSVENVMLYRIKGIEEENAARYESELADLRRKAIRANLLENSMQPVYNAIAMLGVVFVISLGGARTLSGGWTVGQFSAYVTIYVAMAFKASKASKLFNSVQKAQVSWKRIKPYLAETGSSDEACSAAPAGSGPLLSVTNLSFCHAGAAEPVISGVSFEGAPGAIIGITGPVASGKSSLGLALTGLYPYSGSVRIDGRELSSLTPDERAALISYQGHRSELLSDSIRENITLGTDREGSGNRESSADVSGADVSAVLRDVAFGTDLAGMPDGTETLVGAGGVRLSGGQQSRIALARALYGGKRLIILDDPFSAVDVRTEEEIIANVRAHYPQSLIVLVSHRLTIFPKADLVVLLHGRGTGSAAGAASACAVEYGTHESLMKTSSLYREIFTLQCSSCGGLYEAE